MSEFEGLDAPCPTCQRESGDHTLREWAECLKAAGQYIPAFDPPAGAGGKILSENLRERFGLEEGTIVADNAVVYASLLDIGSGPVKAKMPAILHDFGSSGAGKVETVAKVVFVGGNPDNTRAYGRLVRDMANRAANAVEKQ